MSELFTRIPSTLRWPVLFLLLFLSSAWVILGSSVAEEPDRSGKINDYDQWKQALGAGEATAAGGVLTLPSYEVELLRSARPEDGSWVALAFDPQGRLTIAREDKGLLRLALPKDPAEITPAAVAELPLEKIDDTLLECRGLLYAHGSLFANANDSHALYRLTDTTGDGRFDEVKLLRTTGGDVGHGRNNLTLGPDGRIYLIHGNDTHLPDDFLVGSSPYRQYGVDKLLPCEWNNQLFNAGALPPAGHVIRTDAEGKTWELVAGGLRNPFGIDFNPEGEMFTFDADMEWDVGLPWYRPCRVNHLVSGGEYGWRQGTGKWPAWYPDGCPSTFDVGLASPTSVQFGTKSHFPPQYQRALFICDWAYGRILAVHLQPRGASYTATAETFARGRPLNVTGLTFGPDGAMYFTTGGRKTQAGLYRIRYTGPPEPDEPLAPEALQVAATARALRHKLESFHGRVDAKAIETAWPHLASDDLWIRHAARVAVEAQPVSQWQELAFEEHDQATSAEALLALARVGSPQLQPRLLARLAELPWNELSAEWQLVIVRAVQLSLIRQGIPAAESLAQLESLWNSRYPAVDTRVNQLLSELLVAVHSAEVVTKSLPLLAKAATQEERIHYLFTLRHVKSPWKPAERSAYFRWLAESDAFLGARYVSIIMANVKKDALANLSAAELALYQPLLERKLTVASESATPDRPHVRDWTMDDLAGSLDEIGRGRDLQRGKAMFAAANCAKCHRYAGTGQNFGPDLTGVARRFGRRDLLESILFPSKVIDDKFRNVILATDDGRVIIGGLMGSDEQMLHLAPDPAAPGKLLSIPKSSIESQQFSLVSPMPQGALNTLSKDEILDLLAYLESLTAPSAPPSTVEATKP